MYISEVSGHHNATLAIGKALKLLDPGAEITNINAFNYTNPIAEKIVNTIYMGIIKVAPRIWDYLYDNPKVVKSLEAAKKNLHKTNAPKMKRLFDRLAPDVVVCTQAFPCGMVADYKRVYGVDLPLVAVLTDYVPHSYWIYDAVDCYITPSEDVSARLVKKGVPVEKVKPLGIPFDPKFNESLDKNAILRRYKLQPGVPTVLIMGGGQGLGPIKKIVKALEKVQKDIQEIVVTGTNSKLYNSLRRKIKRYKKKIVVFGYAQNINELMFVSDIVISKPGGVTTSEVLAKAKPMIIVKPLPGQEANNTAYLTQKGAALKIEDPARIDVMLNKLLDDPLQLGHLSAAAGRIGKPNASTDIARLLLNGAR
ncbi:MAG: glycosyltransferase [Candidatus Omnitrophota bacterium]